MMNEYIELHCHSYYSLLDGASSPEALVQQAASLGYRALAVTDHNGLYGAVRFWQAAKAAGIKPIFGAELSLQDTGHLTLLVETQRGYANLCQLISTAQLAGAKGSPHLTMDMLASRAEGLLCLSGCRQGVLALPLTAGETQQAVDTAKGLRDIFSRDRFWIELQRHLLPSDRELVSNLVDLATQLEVRCVATNNVHYAERTGQRLHDVLTCIRNHTTLPEALMSGILHPNSELFLKAPAEMRALFADLPQVISDTLGIAERCNASLDFIDQRLPSFPLPPEHTHTSYLHTLAHEGLLLRYNPVTPEAQAQLAHELAVIERMGLAGYFLVVWDIVRFARSRGIRCQGRGSAANSLVAYVLDITPVDPLRYNLLFERFLNENARTIPDIDIDFAADRREEVIEYVYQRYGEEHTAMVCNTVTYQARLALREVAKAICFPPDVIGRLAKAVDWGSTAQAADQVERANPELFAESSGASLPWRLLVELLREISDVPRHISIHVGGMLITAAPLVQVVPVERATMPGRVVVQWDKDSVEDAGLIKIDLLSLRTLGMITEALGHIREQRSVDLDLDHLPLDDPAVYDMLQRADAVGCFQVESRAQAQMLPRLRPERFEDIVVEVALVRPGPIQGHAVHPYLQRRQGREPVTYLHPSLESALAETYGVIVFQEQVIRVAIATAGFSPAEADQLRRAMSRSRKIMGSLRERFLQGARAKGVDHDIAEQIFQQLAGFAEYGFCKSHAAAFAAIAYQTLYLKAHFAPEFFCSLLNHQPMGFYSPEVLQGDAQRHGVPILGPDINGSDQKCTLARQGDATAIRLGLEYVLGLGERWQDRIVEQRGTRLYSDLQDLWRRTQLPRTDLENLIRAGAMDGWGRSRRDLLWQLGALHIQEQTLDIDVPIIPATMPRLSTTERLGWEYELLGLAPGNHMMNLYRERLDAQGILTSKAFQEQSDGQQVQVAGMVVVRQRPPTAKGMAFITLEDEEGLINLIIRPDVYERHRDIIRHSPLLVVRGRVQREGWALSVLVQSLHALQ